MKQLIGCASLILLAALPSPALARGKPRTQLMIVLPAHTDSATITVDGKVAPQFTVAPQTMSPGTHTILVQGAGFKDYFMAVTLAPGQVKRLSVVLESTLLPVDISSTPAAKLLVDGELAGETPKQVPLAAGTHLVTLRKDGFTDKTEQIDVSADGPKAFNFALTASGPAPKSDVPLAASTLTPPAHSDEGAWGGPEAEATTRASGDAWYTRWYVWAGAGAVVVAAVVTGVAVAASPRKPPGPTVVCGGPCDVVVNGP